MSKNLFTISRMDVVFSGEMTIQADGGGKLVV